MQTIVSTEMFVQMNKLVDHFGLQEFFEESHELIYLQPYFPQ